MQDYKSRFFLRRFGKSLGGETPQAPKRNSGRDRYWLWEKWLQRFSIVRQIGKLLINLLPDYLRFLYDLLLANQLLNIHI